MTSIVQNYFRIKLRSGLEQKKVKLSSKFQLHDEKKLRSVNVIYLSNQHGRTELITLKIMLNAGSQRTTEN